MSASFRHAARPAAAFVALAWTALTFATTVAPSPAQAADGAFYKAELTAPAKTGKTIASGQLWSCTGNACVSGKGTSRPAIVCARLAREVGPLNTFVAGGKALEAEELARCNGR